MSERPCVPTSVCVCVCKCVCPTIELRIIPLNLSIGEVLYEMELKHLFLFIRIPRSVPIFNLHIKIEIIDYYFSCRL